MLFDNEALLFQSYPPLKKKKGEGRSLQNCLCKSENCSFNLKMQPKAQLMWAPQTFHLYLKAVARRKSRNPTRNDLRTFVHTTL